MVGFSARLRDALSRRLYPNTSLHLKEIAGAIGRSPNTVTRWWRGETHATGEDLFRIAQFFRRRGDDDFLQEVFSDLPLAKLTDVNFESRASAALRTADGERHRGGGGSDRTSWVTADGGLPVAPAGHSEYIRRTLEMPRNGGDLVAYATRVLGWIAVTERSDGIVIVRHDGRRVAGLAAERVCQWLNDHADRISSVRRVIHLDDRWIEASHSDMQSAIDAIIKTAFIARITRQRWQLRRLPLPSIADARLKKLLKAYYQSPENIVHAAAAMGAFTTSSLFRIKGEEVTSHHVATGFGFNSRTIEGVNVLSRADTDYGLMLQARILGTRQDGPNYHELTGTIDDYRVRYLNLSLSEPGAEGRVLTSSVVLEKSRIAL